MDWILRVSKLKDCSVIWPPLHLALKVKKIRHPSQEECVENTLPQLVGTDLSTEDLRGNRS